MERSCPAGRLRFCFWGRGNSFAARRKRQHPAGDDGRKQASGHGSRRWQEGKCMERRPDVSCRRRAPVSRRMRHGMPRMGIAGKDQGSAGRRKACPGDGQQKELLCPVRSVTDPENVCAGGRGFEGERISSEGMSLSPVSSSRVFFSAARPGSAARS